jgi:acyl carrier protein
LSEGSCVPQLAAIVAEVLKIDPKEIKADTDLHEYGVDSILLTEIVLKIDRLFDIELEPNDVLENPTLRGMSRFLIERIGRGPAAVRPPLPPLEKDQAAMSSTVEPPGRPSRERGNRDRRRGGADRGHRDGLPLSRGG